MAADGLVVYFDQRFENQTVVLGDEVVLLQKRLADEQEGYLFARSFLDLVAEVAETAEADVALLLEDVVHPLD